MNLNWQELVGRTDLKNKECVVETLNKLQVVSLVRLDNLPGNYGQPWFCENSTNEVVIKLREAMAEAVAEVPTIDEVIEAIPEPEEPEPERVVISAEMPVTDLKIDGVSSTQLAAIVEAGVETVGELFDKADALEEVDGIGKATKLRILEAVTTALENK